MSYEVSAGSNGGNRDDDFLKRLELILAGQNEKVLGKVGEIANDVDAMKDEIEKVKTDIYEIKNEEEVTTQQKKRIRAAVMKQVYLLLNLPLDKRKWTVTDRLVSKQYGSLFFNRCYAETSRKGHLASPYEETTKRNFTDAIKDIEAWTPVNGIEALKKEADDNAIAREIAKKRGYRS